MRLKTLYKYLIESQKHEWQGWHDNYKAFFECVEQIRIRIESGRHLSQRDEPFLEKLLRSRDNGISSNGQSVLSDENFQSFIQDKDFMSALERFILKPTRDNFEKFKRAWTDQRKSNNPLLINRVASACTLDVSTTVDNYKFNQVFSWLIRERIIDDYPSGKDQGWFAKNQFLMNKIKDEFQLELQHGQTDKFYLSQFVWSLFVWSLPENRSRPFTLKRQIVKYGSPGTGKTYQARRQAALLFDIWKEEFAPGFDYTLDSQMELIQFHPSFSYEDFMEGLRPILDDNGSAQLTLQNGIFKEFCRKAGKWEIDVHGLGLGVHWDSLKIEELLPHKGELTGAYWGHIFEVPDKSKLLADAVPPFFFIIDEINRAELSRVFGELMYCLEYRGVQDGCVKTQYTSLNNEMTGMIATGQGYVFFIPSNVYLIGTMNTIDRSVESFDFALRRRFLWEEVTPDIGLLKYHLQERWVELANDLKRLNDKIAKQPLLGSDYLIGHAYLMNMKYPNSLTVSEARVRVWDDCIRPLLQEYLRGTGQEEELMGEFGTAFGV